MKNTEAYMHISMHSVFCISNLPGVRAFPVGRVAVVVSALEVGAAVAGEVAVTVVPGAAISNG